MDAQKNKEPLHAAEVDRSKWTTHSNHHNIKCFTEAELKRITDDYKTILGRGGFGVVYKGVLEDNSMVAVKRFIHNVKENFEKELIVHREINHKNVVRLIGYCVEENAQMMVTEFIPNGNLAAILHHDNTPIPLHVRLRIATQCAEALAYMHYDMHTHVIHGDIKPDNILLDGNLNAKISDFGISRLVNKDKYLYTSHVIGTIGYMDPLFARDGRLTAKSDVYSFGVVLLELLTTKNATIELTADREASLFTIVSEGHERVRIKDVRTRQNATEKVTTDNKENLINIFSEAHERDRIKDMRQFLDPELDPWRNKNILDEVVKLAAECLVLDRKKRIEMKHVVKRLGKGMKASLEGKHSLDFSYWARKTKTAWPVNVPATARASSPCRCSYAEIVVATRNFDKSRLLGQGRFCRFYHGVIHVGPTKVMVAVERCWLGYHYHPVRLFQSAKTSTCSAVFSSHNKPVQTSISTYFQHFFYSFVESRWRLSHTNIVPLIGYCDENGEKTLVYNYMDQRSLGDHLFGTLNPLTWKQRLEICIGVARGLHYLHTCAIIHRDLKPENILLDKELVTKISGNKMTDPPFTRMAGCRNARDPEFDFTERLTEKSDVYSFGAVLLEVLCAQRRGDSYYLKGWARSCMTNFSLIDSYLKGSINPKCLEKFVETAFKCVSWNGVDRPSMGDVVSDLESALELQLAGECRGELMLS